MYWAAKNSPPHSPVKRWSATPNLKSALPKRKRCSETGTPFVYPIKIRRFVTACSAGGYLPLCTKRRWFKRTGRHPAPIDLLLLGSDRLGVSVFSSAYPIPPMLEAVKVEVNHRRRV